jgi:hypothetical protein
MNCQKTNAEVYLYIIYPPTITPEGILLNSNLQPSSIDKEIYISTNGYSK